MSASRFDFSELDTLVATLRREHWRSPELAQLAQEMGEAATELRQALGARDRLLRILARDVDPSAGGDRIIDAVIAKHLADAGAPLNLADRQSIKDELVVLEAAYAVVRDLADYSNGLFVRAMDALARHDVPVDDA